MAAKVSGTFSKVSKPPSGEPFVWLPLELLCSEAWRSMSIHCHRLIWFLCIEQLHHAGKENGQLAAPYNQLVKHGIGRRFISEAIKEAEARGLIEVHRGGKRNQLSDHMSRYELTWLAAKRTPSNQYPYWVEPENKWKTVGPAHIAKYKAEKKLRKKQTSGAPMVNLIGAPVVNLPSAPIVNLAT